MKQSVIFRRFPVILLPVLLLGGCCHFDNTPEISLELIDCRSGEAVPPDSNDPLTVRVSGLELPPDGLNRIEQQP